MRLFFAFSLMCAVTTQSIAGCENSTLVIHTTSGIPVKVYIDGVTGRNHPSQAVTVNELSPGSHILKVVQVYTDDFGYTKRHVVYNGTIQVRPSMHMEARVEEGRGVSIHETRVECGDEYAQGAPPQEHSYRDYRSDQGNPQGIPPANNGGYNQNPSYAAPAPSQNNGGYQASAPQVSSTPAHISDDDFDRIKSTIASTQYETRKMDTLKTLISGYNFTTAEVGTLMGLFAFESNKLDVAKLMYSYTVDPQNYSKLSGNFNFDARKEDFKKFMAGK